MNKPKIGITVGDINGVGLEVILKTLAYPKVLEQCTPIIFGSSKVVSYHKNIVNSDIRYHVIRDLSEPKDDEINVFNCWQDNVNITLGKITEAGGIYALKSLEAATSFLKSGELDALVTAPIHKEAMSLCGFGYPGHTEFLTHQLEVEESLMFMVSDQMKVALVTNHIPISQVAESITPGLVRQKIDLLHRSLIEDFALEKPTLAVLGLNPHAGDGGVIGREDLEIIKPVVEEYRSKGMLIRGPFPADGFFGSESHTRFDALLAMYHDQGLIPFKLLSFGSGTNFTAGLPAIRTSPDHGTAMDIAGKNEADHRSFMKSLFLAIDLTRNRTEYLEMRQFSLVRDESLVQGEDEEPPEDED